jgi:hypothetical protein
MQQVADIGCVRLADQRRRLDLRRVLKATQDRHKGGHPFGIGIGVDTAATMSTPPARSLNGFGAMMVDANGDITVKSDPRP